MRNEFNELEQLVSSAITSLNLELTGVTVSSQRPPLIRVYLDKDGGISVEDCKLAGKQIKAVLDVEHSSKGNYTLEVSSPGLDRKLFTVNQLAQQVGNKVKLKLYFAIDGRRSFSGDLQEMSEDKSRCTLVIDGTLVEFKVSDVSDACLVPDL